MSKEYYMFTKFNNHNEVEYYGVKILGDEDDNNFTYKFDTKKEAQDFLEDYIKFINSDED